MCARMFWQWPCVQTNKLADVQWFICAAAFVIFSQFMMEWIVGKKHRHNSAKTNNNEAQHTANATAYMCVYCGRNTVKRNFLFKNLFVHHRWSSRSGERTKSHNTIICHWALVARLLLLSVLPIGVCRWLSVAMVKASPLLRFITHVYGVESKRWLGSYRHT